MLRLWKGLFYCMWMCDKAPVQEELATNLASIAINMPSTDTALLYSKSFFTIMEREWAGIDNLR